METVTTALLRQVRDELHSLRQDHEAFKLALAREVHTSRVVLDEGLGLQTTTIVPGAITLEHDPKHDASGSLVFLAAQAHHAEVTCLAGTRHADHPCTIQRVRASVEH